MKLRIWAILGPGIRFGLVMVTAMAGGCLPAFGAQPAALPQPSALPGTELLTMSGDLAAALVAGVASRPLTPRWNAPGR